MCPAHNDKLVGASFFSQREGREDGKPNFPRAPHEFGPVRFSVLVQAVSEQPQAVKAGATPGRSIADDLFGPDSVNVRVDLNPKRKIVPDLVSRSHLCQLREQRLRITLVGIQDSAAVSEVFRESRQVEDRADASEGRRLYLTL